MHRQALFFAALLLSSACSSPGSEAPGDAPPSAASTEPWAPPDWDGRSLADELAWVDGGILPAVAKAEASETDWLSRTRAAGSLLTRAKLTGSYDDYARAEELLAEAFAQGAATAGPLGTRASLNFTLHRLDRVGPDLDQIEALPSVIRLPPYDLSLRRGVLAMELGDYAAARGHLQAAVDGSRSLGSLATLGLWYWQTGDFETAESLYKEAFSPYHGRLSQPVAWLHLQLGLLDLDRGRWDQAMAHYQDARAVLPGWYLVDEHVAEILTLRGQTGEAIAMYERIIDETGNPEFMDAMARIEIARGNSEAAVAWIARGDEAYAVQLGRFPEAAWGHALGHFQEFGEPAQALDLAVRNHELRPNGQAKVWLAEALLASNRAADAALVIEEALASPYRSAPLFAVASRCYAALGDRARSDQHRGAALLVNPHAFE
jgi:tetratricopeptide (TPR) repeat protein